MSNSAFMENFNIFSGICIAGSGGGQERMPDWLWGCVLATCHRLEGARAYCGSEVRMRGVTYLFVLILLRVSENGVALISACLDQLIFLVFVII